MTDLDTRVLGEEIYLTGKAESSSSADELFGVAAETLGRRGACPLSIRAYGPPAKMREARLRSGLDAEAPVTWLDSRPPRIGLQIWAATGRVSTEGSGRLWTGDRFRALLLSGIRGEGPDAVHQAGSMLAHAGERLEAGGFSWRNTVRTWIYLSRLLDWYGDFNRVRTNYFGAVAVGSSTGFPASTGIQGRSGAGEECQMDLLAVDGLEARFIRRTRRQSEAFDYGSAFSRGVVLERDGHRTIHVSGTASIDSAGRTVHLDDPTAQMEETLDGVAAVLETEGAGLSDIVSSTLFCRDANVMDACLKVLRTPGRPSFPFIPVIADVCRKDLLVELEAVAAL